MNKFKDKVSGQFVHDTIPQSILRVNGKEYSYGYLLERDIEEIAKKDVKIKQLEVESQRLQWLIANMMQDVEKIEVFNGKQV